MASIRAAEALAVPEPVAAVEVAELIVRFLETAGVEYVFGIPGGAVEPIYNALARSERRGGPRAVVARHEAGAAFMADGYARETGKLGVCVSTSGPGATNLLTGVACAYSSNVPLLALTAQSALPTFGRGALQDSSCTGIDVVAMFRHCTRFNSFVSHPQQLEAKLVSAILHALGRPSGPAHLSIPVDVLRAPVTPSQPRFDRALLARPPCLIDERAVAALDAELTAARRPVFLIGAGAGDAVEPILNLVRFMGAIFVTTPDGKGLVDPRHPAYRGVFGFSGHSSAERAVEEADLVVAFATGFGEMASGGWSASVLHDHLVHVDDEPENLHRSPMARLHVLGHLRSVCERILAARRASLDGMVQRRPAALAGSVSLRAPEQYRSEAAPIKPQRLMKELSERVPPGTRFVAESGNCLAWSFHYLQPRRSPGANWLRVALEFAPMGWAIGAAVGIARGKPGCPVVCLTGDGAYLMSGQEITTALEERLPVLFVILNDQAYGMVMHGQRLAGAEPIAFQLPPVDFRAMAEAVGVPGHVIESPADFDRLDLAGLLAHPGPALLDVRIDREEVPPMMLRLKTLGTSKE
jgi:acetolactate synthase-1/2/3 large subunit